MISFKTVDLAVSNGICTIALNRPESLNAMNRLMIDEITLAFNQANEDEATSVIIFTGKGRAFCAGDDRHEHVHPENRSRARDLVEAIQRATNAIVLGRKLVVGAINGWAVGVGFEWAINCDFPIWAKNARGFFPEVSLNLFVTGGVTTLLPALVGLNKAREMLFLGKQYNANMLLDMGVAWKVAEDNDLLKEANRVALSLAKLPTLSSRAMKRVLHQTALNNFRNAVKLETEATIEGFMDPQTTRLLKEFGR
jgi:enoyl-CoA hydratase/carnithine racemase